jgi:hypothetical protein
MQATTSQDKFLTVPIPRQFVMKDSDFHQFINIKAILKQTLGLEVSYKEHDSLDNDKYVATFTVTNWGITDAPILDTLRSK